MFGNGNDIINFQGQLGQLTVTLVNDYDGTTLSIDEEKNINTGFYDGLGGIDTLFMTSLGDALFIEAEDEVTGAPVQAVVSVETFIAGNGGDVIDLSSTQFTLGDITILGGAGDDILWSNIGNDSIFGSLGNDNINGGPGDDNLNGGNDDDVIIGGDGNDRVNGDNGNDTLFGNDGNDRIDGGTGNDTLFSGDGHDSVIGGDGDDVLHGDAGNDILIAGRGNDILIGGTGTNTYSFTTAFDVGQVDTIIQTANIDNNVIHFNGTATLGDISFSNTGNDLNLDVAGLYTIIIQGHFDSETSGIDELIFSSKNRFDLRTIEKTNEAPIAQDDEFTMDEDTSLNGNLLADNGNGVDSDPEGDAISVQATTLTTAAGASVVINANGSFTYTPVTDFFGEDSFEYILQDANLATDTGSVTITVNDVVEDLVLIGDENDNTLIGGDGNDTISGLGGSDLLDGGAGNDTLIYSGDEIWPTGFVAHNVGSPDAIINGDRIVVNPRFRNHDGFEGGDGIDTIQMSDEAEAIFLDDRYSDNPFGFNTARIRDVEIIRAGGGNDIVDLTSKQFSYGDVEIYGEDGNDVLWSSAGDDFISGGAGNDHLDTGTGDDVLFGGAGQDKLYGRGGDDTFVFEGETSFDAVDRIADWNDGDKLDISDILSDAGFDAVNDAISDFVNIRTQNGDSFLQIDLDGTGNGAVFQDIVQIDNQTLDLATLVADTDIIV